MLVNILCLRTEYFFTFFYSFLQLGGTPLSSVKDAVWHEVSKEHGGILHVPLACHPWEARLLIKEGAPKIPSSHMAIAHKSRGGPVVKVSLMWEEHYRVGFWKTAVGEKNCGRIIICGCRQPCRGSSKESLKQGCVLSLKQSVLRCPQQWKFILWSSGSGHCLAWQVGISLETPGSCVILKCWVFSCRTIWYPNPQDHNMVWYAACTLTLGGVALFAHCLLMHFFWKAHFNSLPWT
jgi:hypothetical protein